MRNRREARVVAMRGLRHKWKADVCGKSEPFDLVA